MLTVSVPWYVLFFCSNTSLLLLLLVTTAAVNSCFLHFSFHLALLPLHSSLHSALSHSHYQPSYCPPRALYFISHCAFLFRFWSIWARSFPHVGLLTALPIFHLPWGVSVIDAINGNYAPTSKTNSMQLSSAGLLSSLVCLVHLYSRGCALCQQCEADGGEGILQMSKAKAKIRAAQETRN